MSPTPHSKSASHAREGWVAFVGAGPGDESLLTLRATDLLGQADLVVATPEVAEHVRHLLAPEAELADASDLDANPKLVLSAARAGKLVVRLYRGDALAFSGAAEEAAACAKAGIRFEIAPGLPAATAVPAYAGIPLTTESRADVRIIHAAELSRAPAGPGTLVILGAESGPSDIGKMLVAAGWPQDTPFAVTWNGTTTAQQTVVTTIGSVAADLKAAGISMLTTHAWHSRRDA